MKYVSWNEKRCLSQNFVGTTEKWQTFWIWRSLIIFLHHIKKCLRLIFAQRSYKLLIFPTVWVYALLQNTGFSRKRFLSFVFLHHKWLFYTLYQRNNYKIVNIFLKKYIFLKMMPKWRICDYLKDWKMYMTRQIRKSFREHDYYVRKHFQKMAIHKMTFSNTCTPNSDGSHLRRSLRWFV